MADTVYFDCPRNNDGEPIRADQMRRLKAALCVYCGVLPHATECPEKWEAELSTYGLSRNDISREDARGFSTTREDEGGAGQESEATAFYRFRSSRERNFAKRDVPSWGKSDGALYILMSSYNMSRKRALQTFRAVYEKWRSKEKINASKKDHARLRKCLERLRKDAESLKKELVDNGMKPEHAEAYLADPTLKKLHHPENVEPEYPSAVLQAVLQMIDRGLLPSLLHLPPDVLNEVKLTLVRKMCKSMWIETMNELWEKRPDRSPKDPSSKDLAELLGLNTITSDTYK